MGRIFGLLMIVGLVWIGLEIYSEGVENAFGGILASGSADDSTAGRRLSAPERAGRALQRAHEERAQRFDRLVEQGR